MPRHKEAGGPGPVEGGDTPAGGAPSDGPGADAVRLRPSHRSHGSLIVLIFVVLTLAALALAIFVIPKLFGSGSAPPASNGAPASSVTGREAAPVGWTAQIAAAVAPTDGWHVR